jgi:hypothetical protein
MKRRHRNGIRSSAIHTFPRASSSGLKYTVNSRSLISASSGNFCCSSYRGAREKRDFRALGAQQCARAFNTLNSIVVTMNRTSADSVPDILPLRSDLQGVYLWASSTCKSELCKSHVRLSMTSPTAPTLVCLKNALPSFPPVVHPHVFVGVCRRYQ